MIAADASDLDRLADALREDGVVIDRVLGGGEAQRHHDRIAALIREVPFPVYVALVEKPDGLSGDGHQSSEALAALLHRRIGGEAMYVVGTTAGYPQVVSFGLGADPALLSLSASANADLVVEEAKSQGAQVGLLPRVLLASAHVQEAEALVAEAKQRNEPGVYPPTLTEDEVTELADETVAMVDRADWRPDIDRFVEVHEASRGFSVFMGGLAGLVVALLLGQTLRGWPHRALPARGRKGTTTTAPGPQRPQVPVASTERTRARTLLDTLAGELSKVDWRRLDTDLGNAALAARTAAEQLLDSDDVADLLGAQALARTGSRDLVRARRGGSAYRPCFFDPRHGEAPGRVGWKLGEGRVEVPCCKRCAADVDAAREPAVLHLPGRRGPQPYWKRRDVWATTGFGAVTDSLATDVLRDREVRR